MDLLDDYRHLPCPMCKEVGGIFIDHASAQFKCRKCKKGGFNPHTGQNVVPQKTQPQTQAQPTGGYPPVPAGTPYVDQIEEHIIIKEGGIPKRKPLRTIYCPKVTVKEEPFNPNDPHFQFHMYLGLAEEGQKRRRRNRDIIRRAKQEGRIKQPA